jgi:hypothetical protein
MPTKKPQKYEYHRDVNATPLPKDFIAVLCYRLVVDLEYLLY